MSIQLDLQNTVHEGMYFYPMVKTALLEIHLGYHNVQDGAYCVDTETNDNMKY